MADMKEIDEARKALGLDEEATPEEIKSAYRHLAMKYHPDRCADKTGCEEMFKKADHAYGVLMAYCAGYKFSFREEDVRKNSLDEKIRDHMRRFNEPWRGEDAA